MSAWHHIVPLRTVEGLFSTEPNPNPVWTQAHWQETGSRWKQPAWLCSKWSRLEKVLLLEACYWESAISDHVNRLSLSLSSNVTLRLSKYGMFFFKFIYYCVLVLFTSLSVNGYDCLTFAQTEWFIWMFLHFALSVYIFNSETSVASRQKSMPKS